MNEKEILEMKESGKVLEKVLINLAPFIEPNMIVKGSSSRVIYSTEMPLHSGCDVYTTEVTVYGRDKDDYEKPIYLRLKDGFISVTKGIHTRSISSAVLNWTYLKVGVK